MLKKSDPVERILLRNNKLTEKTLGEVKANQLQAGRYLGKTLVDHGYIHADVLLETLSKELSLPFISLEEYAKNQLPIKELNISEAFFCIFFTFEKKRIIFIMLNFNLYLIIITVLY